MSVSTQPRFESVLISGNVGRTKQPLEADTGDMGHWLQTSTASSRGLVGLVLHFTLTNQRGAGYSFCCNNKQCGLIFILNKQPMGFPEEESHPGLLSGASEDEDDKTVKLKGRS